MFPVLFTSRDSLNGNQEKEYVATAGTRPELTEGALHVERHGNPSGELQPVPVHVDSDPPAEQ